MDRQSSPTWILFESGNAAAVDLGLYAAANGSSRPIDAYMVAECEGDFTKAARRAADAVYHIFQKKYDTAPLVAGYDIQTTAGQALTGGSGGLSFAVALAKALYPGDDPGPVAATGEINSRGQISAISGIEAKIDAAFKLLPAQGWLFYPAANETEIKEGRLAEFAAKGIRVRAVSNISDVLDLLFGWSEAGSGPAPTSRLSKFVKPLIVSVLIVAGAMALIQNRKEAPLPEKHTEGPPIIKTAPQEKRPPPEINQRVNPASALERPETVLPGSPVWSGKGIELYFSGETPLEKKIAALLAGRLGSYITENGVTGDGVIIAGMVEAQLPDRFNGRKSGVLVSLRGFNIQREGEALELPDLTAGLTVADNQETVPRQAVEQMALKIVKALNLEEENGKKPASGRSFKFSPLAGRPEEKKSQGVFEPGNISFK